MHLLQAKYHNNNNFADKRLRLHFGWLPKIYLYHAIIPQDAVYGVYSHIERMKYKASTIFASDYSVVRFLKEHHEILQRDHK